MSGKYRKAPLGGRNAAAVTVNQTDQWNPVLMREVVDESALSAFATTMPPAGSAADGGVFPANGHRAAVDFGNAHHIGSRCDLDQPALLIVLAFAGQLADFLKAVGIDNSRDALPHRKETLFVT